ISSGHTRESFGRGFKIAVAILRHTCAPGIGKSLGCQRKFPCPHQRIAALVRGSPKARHSPRAQGEGYQEQEGREKEEPFHCAAVLAIQPLRKNGRSSPTSTGVSQ